MRVTFNTRVGLPERCMAEAAVEFTDGPLAGMKLTGFTVWHSGESDAYYVTFPSRAFGAGPDRRYLEFLRPGAAGATATRRVKDWLLAEWRRQCESGCTCGEAYSKRPEGAGLCDYCLPRMARG